MSLSIHREGFQDPPIRVTKMMDAQDIAYNGIGSTRPSLHFISEPLVTPGMTNPVHTTVWAAMMGKKAVFRTIGIL